MQRRQSRPHLSSPLRPISVAVLIAFAGSRAWGAEAAAAIAGPATEIQFEDAYVRQPNGARVDISRFSKGNVALPGDYQADLYVNQVWVGRTQIRLRQLSADSNDVQACFDAPLLERIGVDLSKLTPEAGARLAAGGACLTLPSLVTDATASFDNGEQRLDLSVPQVALVRSARGYVDPRYWDDGVTAGTLQYNASTYHTETSGESFNQSYVGLNAGINVGSWRLRHMGSLTDSTFSGTHYQSVQTNLQRAIVPWKSQLTVGDGFTDGSVFDSVGFRGVQLASDDRMYPQSQRGYAPTIRGIANSNARVQVRQNGNIIYETTVAPGSFEIDDLYPTGYGGDLQVIVTEADGSVHTFSTPYAATVNALRPGITRFSVMAGEYRNPGIHSKPKMIQVTFQHGFNNLLTGYGGFQVAQGYAAAQVGVGLTTGLGAFGLDFTKATADVGTNQPRHNGESLRLSYSKVLAPTRTNLAVAAYRYSSRGYLGLADFMTLRDPGQGGLGYLTNGVPRGRLQLTLSQPLPSGLGSFYVSGSTQSYWGRENTNTQAQAGYTNNYKRLNYSLEFSRQQLTTLSYSNNAYVPVNPAINIATAPINYINKWDNRVMLTLSFPLGRSPRAPTAMTSVQGGGSGPTTVQQSVNGTLGVDSAFGYGLNAGYSGSSDTTRSATTAGANASYRSPLTTLTATLSHSSNYNQQSFGVSGGVVVYGGGVAFTPTMGDTIAVVEAKDAAGARVVSGSGLRVDPWGHAIVSSLTPFASNQIEIDPKGLPLNVAIKSSEQSVAPTAGAVVRLAFETEDKGRAAILHIKTTDGKPAPFGAEVTDEQGQSIGTVGQAGRVIASGFKTETGSLRVSWGEGASERCVVAYRLPKADPRSDAFGTVVDTVCQ